MRRDAFSLTEPTMKNKPAPIIECAHLRASDFTTENGMIVIVKTGKGSNFRVERYRNTYQIYSRTEFVGGSTIVHGIDAVRRLLVTR